jgi:hypothetical protein
MNGRGTRRLDLGRGLLFAVAGFFGIVEPVVFGQMQTLPGTASPTAPAPITTAKTLEFEVASVRNNKSEDAASMNIPSSSWRWPRSTRKLIPRKKYKAYPVHRFCL